MDIIEAEDIITVVRVANAERAKTWYTKLFGKGPDLEPFPGHLEFKIGGAWVQIREGEVKPSSWSIEFGVKDLRRERERLRSSGIQATEIESRPGVISWFNVVDPDGNNQRWFQVLS